jgi:nucleoside-diphosphate-sugar epimerase
MATIFGEGDPGNIARLMRAIDLQRFVWVGRGSNFKSLIFRSDAARACFLAAQSPNLAPEDNHCSIYNISLPPVRMAQIVDVLSTALGRNVPRWYIPARAVRMFTQGMSVCMADRGPLARVRKTINKWLADDIYPGHRFEHDYGFRPEVSVEEGLRREVAWFRHSKAA